jgi:alpha-L-rhamnosidase
VYLREYANPDILQADFFSSDPRLNRIFAAGVETFRQNSVDLFMDCPSRERAGWLCDSYFTARVAMDLSGNTLVEKNFLENFTLPDKFPNIPQGMLPMCYPADHRDGVFIPNWSLWFVIQLEEYLERSRDGKLVASLRPRIMRLFEYFDHFENENGLLESLESWIFIEWSKANDFVQDVNYPTNMLYSAALKAAGKIYNIPEYVSEAEEIRDTIRKQSFNGSFFVDNAERNPDGNLTVTANTSEVCQYYAFYFNIASPESHPELWQKLLTGFGPDRKVIDQYPHVHFANAFPGTYLRLELLSRYNETRHLLDESIDYLHYMAEKTGTLWENLSPTASCNHGFASHAVHFLYRDVLGFHKVDRKNKQIQLKFSDIGLQKCRGKIPLKSGQLSLEWYREGRTVYYSLQAPADFEIVVHNPDSLILQSE